MMSASTQEAYRFLDVAAARVAFYARAWFTPALAEYLKEHQLNLDDLTRAVGAVAVLPIRDGSEGRFEFGKPDLDDMGFVCEALTADGESTDDLVAWRLSVPDKPMSMLGRVGLIGMIPPAYRHGAALVIHKTPLDYLKAGCSGVAVIDPELGARQLRLGGAAA